jgi:hypothetical protein
MLSAIENQSHVSYLHENTATIEQTVPQPLPLSRGCRAGCHVHTTAQSASLIDKAPISSPWSGSSSAKTTGEVLQLSWPLAHLLFGPSRTSDFTSRGFDALGMLRTRLRHGVTSTLISTLDPPQAWASTRYERESVICGCSYRVMSSTGHVRSDRTTPVPAI